MSTIIRNMDATENIPDYYYPGILSMLYTYDDNKMQAPEAFNRAYF